MTDDAAAYGRRCNLIAQIESSALEGAKGASRAAWQAERILALAEAIRDGRHTPSPQAIAIARKIQAVADRIRRERGWL
jgi:hypothetical protein